MKRLLVQFRIPIIMCSAFTPHPALIDARLYYEKCVVPILASDSPMSASSMSTLGIYDGGRDNFLHMASSRPPSKWDSIESLEHDVHDASTIAYGNTKASRRATTVHSHGRCIFSGGSYSRISSASDSSIGSKATRTSLWKEDLSGHDNRPSTVPSRALTRQVDSVVESGSDHRHHFKTPAGIPKKFLWGPKVVRQGQEAERHVRRTNKGEPATFAMWVQGGTVLKSQT